MEDNYTATEWWAQERQWIVIPIFAVGSFLSRVLLFATPWTAALQASLSITNY